MCVICDKAFVIFPLLLCKVFNVLVKFLLCWECVLMFLFILWPFKTALDAGEEERWAWVVGMPLASLDISILDVECPELERPPLLRMLLLLLILPDSECGERGDDLRP